MVEAAGTQPDVTVFWEQAKLIQHFPKREALCLVDMTFWSLLGLGPLLGSRVVS